MAILKFRVFFEEDDTVYRDIALKHTQTFYELHQTILKGYEFDSIHEAIFYRSNDQWQKGRAISLEKYEGVEYKVDPLDMIETTIGSEIKDTEQKFIYLYDLKKNWIFHIQLINVSKEENPKLTYPAITRKEGIGPSQYGIKSILGDKFADIEEKYDLSAIGEGFSDEGEDESERDDELGGEEAGGEDENNF
ncbi:MAG: IS1096 element passenger TnpR family protein [Bacteroidota bacterium]